MVDPFCKSSPIWESLPGQTPEVGAVRMLGDQIYTVVALVVHRRRDGGLVPLICWQSHCPTCGAAFQFKATLKKSLTVKALNRRCPEHQRPGTRVSKPLNVNGDTSP